MADPKTTEPKKTMDVAKPGKSAPDESARPVIITHKPQVQDTTVKTPESEAPKTVVTHNKVIKPLSEQSAQETPSNTPSAQQDKEPAADTAEAAEEAAVVDAVASQADLGGKNAKTAQEAADQKQQEAIDKLITEKKYFVPVGQVAHRRNQRAGILALVLLLALIGAYVAVDAGLIDLGIELPIDLIKQ